MTSDTPFSGSRAFGLALSLVLSSVVAAQSAPQPDSAATLKAVSVTATRRATDVYSVPAPVTVLDASLLQRRAPAAVTELFRDLAGLDVIGIGANQLRPASASWIPQ